MKKLILFFIFPFMVSLGFAGIKTSGYNPAADGSYVDYNDNTEFDLTGSFTFYALFRVSTYPVNSHYLVSKGGGGGARGNNLYINSNDGTLVFQTSETGAANVSLIGTADPVVNGEITSVVAMISPSNYMRIYKNGRLIAEETASVPATPFDPAVDFRVGSRDGCTGCNSNAEIFEVAVWDDRVISDSDAKLITGMRMVGAPDLIGSTTFHETYDNFIPGYIIPANTTFTDKSGNNIVGTAISGPQGAGTVTKYQ